MQNNPTYILEQPPKVQTFVSMVGGLSTGAARAAWISSDSLKLGKIGRNAVQKFNERLGSKFQF